MVVAADVIMVMVMVMGMVMGMVMVLYRDYGKGQVRRPSSAVRSWKTWESRR